MVVFSTARDLPPYRQQSVGARAAGNATAAGSGGRVLRQPGHAALAVADRLGTVRDPAVYGSAIGATSKREENGERGEENRAGQR